MTLELKEKKFSAALYMKNPSLNNEYEVFFTQVSRRYQTKSAEKKRKFPKVTSHHKKRVTERP